MKYIFSALLLGTITFGGLTSSSAQTVNAKAINADTQVQTGKFTKKRYSVNGSWSLSTVDGRRIIRFSDDFKTKSGPDLKVFLTPKNFDSLDRKTATDGAVKLGVLQSNKGAQFYTIPEDVDLNDFRSVIVHCEAYSVLWGGFDIPE